MEVVEALLKHIIAQNNLQVKVTIEGGDVASLMEKVCFVALGRIRQVLQDDTLNDEECFAKIEAIVSIYEELGMGCGTRHDF